MSDLLCPDCGHSIFIHGHDCQAMIDFCMGDSCNCCNSRESAKEKAQRAAAIAHLQEMGGELNAMRRAKSMSGVYSVTLQMWSAISAYRAIGVLLKERKP